MVRISLLFLVVLFNLGYWYWTTTPYYAVLQIRDSIKEHNLAKFEEFVDIESVAEKMIDGFLTPQMRERLSRGVLGELLGSGIISLMKPTLVDLIKEEVTHFVENNDLQPTASIRRQNDLFAESMLIHTTSVSERILDGANVIPADCSEPSLSMMDATKVTPADCSERMMGERNTMLLAGSESDNNGYSNASYGTLLSDVSLKGLTRKLGFGKGTFRNVSYVRVQQTSATIGLNLYNKKYDTKMLLELKMVKQEGHWRLVEVSNFASFIYTIIANEEARRYRHN